MELQFMQGEPLFVYSKVQSTRAGERSDAFLAFVQDLHERLSAADKRRIAFRRGISSARHRLVMGCTAIFAGVFLFLLGVLLVSKVSFTEALFPVAGCGVLTAGFCNLLFITWPGTYEPNNPLENLLNS